MRRKAPSSTTQQIQWYHTSMCLVCVWYWWSCVSVMAAWLSEKSVIGELKVPKISERRLLSQSPSFMPCIAVTYLLSVMESKMISCHFEDHDTAPPLMRKAYPNM